MEEEKNNICEECGYEGSEQTCPHCGGEMTSLEESEEGEEGEEEIEEESEEEF